MFPKKQRVSRKEFFSVYKKSQTVYFPPLTFKVSLREDKGQKFSIVLPGSWQKEKALRNKTKRRIIGAFKKVINLLPVNVSIICFVKKEVSSLSYKAISEKINSSIKEISKSFPRSNK